MQFYPETDDFSEKFHFKVETNMAIISKSLSMLNLILKVNEQVKQKL